MVHVYQGFGSNEFRANFGDFRRSVIITTYTVKRLFTIYKGTTTYVTVSISNVKHTLVISCHKFAARYTRVAPPLVPYPYLASIDVKGKTTSVIKQDGLVAVFFSRVV